TGLASIARRSLRRSGAGTATPRRGSSARSWAGFEEPVRIQPQAEGRPRRDVEVALGPDAEAPGGEGGGDGARRGDVVVLDPLEADREEGGLHHLVDGGHAEQEEPARREHTRDLAQRFVVLVEVLEHGEAHDEIEGPSLVRQLVDAAPHEIALHALAREERRD